MKKVCTEGNWARITKMAKKAWCELTDDDFKKAECSIIKLCNVIHDRCGDTTEAIAAKLDRRHRSFSRMLDDASRLSEMRCSMRIAFPTSFARQWSGECCG